MIDFTSVADRLDQVAAALDLVAGFLAHWVVPAALALLALGIYHYGRKAQARADALGISVEAWVGARLLLKESGDLSPEEALALVKAEGGEA